MFEQQLGTRNELKKLNEVENETDSFNDLVSMMMMMSFRCQQQNEKKDR